MLRTKSIRDGEIRTKSPGGPEIGRLNPYPSYLFRPTTDYIKPLVSGSQADLLRISPFNFCGFDSMGYLETALAMWGDCAREKETPSEKAVGAYGKIRTKSPAEAQWEALRHQRWGPSVGDATPGIDIPKDWRDKVASWPHGRWVTWRRLATDLLEGLEEEPTAEDIRAADRMAYDMIRAEVTP